MKKPVLSKNSFFTYASTQYLFSFMEPFKNLRTLIIIFSVVIICTIVSKAQESIGSFSVKENTTNGVPTTSSTSKFELYTDRIIIYDKKVVEFPLIDFKVVTIDSKDAVFSFKFNQANSMLEIYEGMRYYLTIVTKNKVEIFKGTGSVLNALSTQLILEELAKKKQQTSNEIISEPLSGTAIQDCTIASSDIKIKTSKDYTDDELFMMMESKLKPIVDKEANFADRISRTDYTEEERKFLDLGYTFPSGTNLDAMRGNEEAKEKEKMKYLAIGIIAIMIIGGLIFILNQNKDSLIKADSKIKSIDDNKLKQNLNLDNSSITEIDDNTLKQKLGL